MLLHNLHIHFCSHGHLHEAEEQKDAPFSDPENEHPTTTALVPHPALAEHSPPGTSVLPQTVTGLE